MTRGRYANIIIDISHEKVDRTFQYKIPEELLGKLEEGTCVQEIGRASCRERV